MRLRLRCLLKPSVCIDGKAMAAYLSPTHRMCYSTCACAPRGRRILLLCLG